MNYTTIEQSKKLLESGLSPESADMYWKKSPILSPEEKWIPRIINNLPILFDDDDIIPCWSIGALLELLPNYQLTRELTGSQSISVITSNGRVKSITGSTSSIELVVRIIEWLKLGRI